MKKLLLIALIATGLMADGDLYIGGALSFSNANDEIVHCRGSANFLLGAEFHSDLLDMSLELRQVTGLGGDYHVREIFIKPQIGNAYALAGWGMTDYTRTDTDFWGGRYGIGYFFGDVFADVIYREPEQDTALSVGFRYFF